ncbi:MAG: protein kinase [Cyanothece sp. SIO1E1]|nr:protein kinase [Cyanothece sp. SIO1E1]
METYCTRPDCPRPVNHFADLDDNATLKAVQQKFCTACGMPQILVGRYLPLKLLGQGGFGAAFLARDRYTPTMRQCVVKLFQPANDLSPAQLQMAQALFEREGEALEDLGRHPQIPDLLAFFELTVPGQSANQSDQFFYLVQEFIDGQDLEQELAQTGKFSEAAVQEVLTSILKVLKFVHENGSIHRDIKPSNIMRHRNGLLYLLDFGAVKQITTGAVAGQAVKSTGIYSVGFAPPEQMAGSTVYPATDLYALAVTCITLLTGKQPTDLYDSYSNTWNWRAYTQVSDLLEAVLNRMLLLTPSQRFQSADEVFAALRSAQQVSAPPVASHPPQPTASGQAARQVVQKAPTPASVPAPATSVQRSAQPPQPPVAQSVPASRAKPVAQLSRPAFSTFELLSGAAFTGFEAGLLAIALFSWLGTSLMSTGFWVALIGLLVLAQSRRFIERLDLVIIAIITLGIVLWLFRQAAIVQSFGNPIGGILFVAIFTALIGVAVTTVFRLIYKLLSGLT